eukprot:Lithocolla_globosa_v1_NODE_301_length_4591_cov_9.161155.p4 type:complete len:114 gc:universal NODE_301_length_4591_cov_9.161155:1237-896(-)
MRAVERRCSATPRTEAAVFKYLAFLGSGSEQSGLVSLNVTFPKANTAAVMANSPFFSSSGKPKSLKACTTSWKSATSSMDGTSTHDARYVYSPGFLDTPYLDLRLSGRARQTW